MGLLHFGQSGVGLVRSVLMMPSCALFVRPALR